MPTIKADKTESTKETKSPRNDAPNQPKVDSNPPKAEETKAEETDAPQPLPAAKIGNEINPLFFQIIRDEYPQILKSNGLKSLQELVHGHRNKLETSEMDILKDIHSGLKALAHGRNLELHRDSDESEIRSDKTISDHIKQKTMRITDIRATTKMPYIPLTKK